jgi:RNA polymerase sigma-70 factor (ECF subfamily)
MDKDSDIIKTIQTQPEEGFRMLLQRYQQPVYWHVRRMVVAHDDAEDATQETFLRVFRSFAQYDEHLSLAAWIFRIATNEALRILGKRKGEAQVSLDEASDDLFDLKADDNVDYSHAEAVKLQKAILSLPAKQQIAFNLRYYDDMSYDDIALVTGSTAANVKANYHIAKEKIVNYLKTND